MTRLLISMANFITLAMAWSGIISSALCYYGRFTVFHWVMFAVTIIAATGANYYILLRQT